MIRSFIAITLDDPTRAFIDGSARSLATALPRVRFVRAETWHITLAFLGDLDDVHLQAAREATHEASAGITPFTLRASGVGIFGAEDEPRVIWMGVGGDRAALGHLQRQVAEAVHQHDLTTDGRFSPHITLARPRHALTNDEQMAIRRARDTAGEGPEFSVSSISLMRSDRLPDGARYTPIEVATFGT